MGRDTSVEAWPMNPGARQGIRVLPKGCVCGHDHTTHRGEEVELCLECSCTEHRPRCQNCGEALEQFHVHLRYDACSRVCAMQLDYVDSLEAA